MTTNCKRVNVLLPICTRHSNYNAQCFNCYQVADWIERDRTAHLATGKQVTALQTVFNSRKVTPIGLNIPMVSKAMRRLV